MVFSIHWKIVQKYQNGLVELDCIFIILDHLVSGARFFVGNDWPFWRKFLLPCLDQKESGSYTSRAYSPGAQGKSLHFGWADIPSMITTTPSARLMPEKILGPEKKHAQNVCRSKFTKPLVFALTYLNVFPVRKGFFSVSNEKVSNNARGSHVFTLVIHS